MSDFNDIPNQINKSKGILNASEGRYEPASEVDGTQPYYKYQGIGRTRAKAPDPPPATTDLIMGVGNFASFRYGYEATQYGTLVPDALEGTTLTSFWFQNPTGSVRIQIHTGGLLISERFGLEFSVDDLGEIYGVGWEAAQMFYNIDVYDGDPDFQKYLDLWNYIVGKDTQEITTKFIL